MFNIKPDHRKFKNTFFGVKKKEAPNHKSDLIRWLRYGVKILKQFQN